MKRTRCLIVPRQIPARTVLIFAMSLILGSAVSAQSVLVDFGSNSGENSFGMPGWNTLIQSGAMSYTSDGPGGLVAAPSVDEYGDYQGVSGSSHSFSTSDRIVATWYNRSSEAIRFTARVSFTDGDQADGGSSSGRWYTMRSFENYRETWTEAQPGQTVQTVFAVRDKGIHKTDSSYSLVNINLAIEWGSSDMKQHLVCDRIELYEDADDQPPAAPGGLRTTSVSDSKIALAWDIPNDNVGVADYLIRVNGDIVGYSRENSYTCVLLEQDTEYRCTVQAMDMMNNASPQSAELAVRTTAFRGDRNAINPEGITYLGAFRTSDDFYWGGEALAYYPQGDGGQTGAGSTDGYPGSLFVTNVNQPENGYVGEISIPAPTTSKPSSTDDLPVATVLNPPVNIRPEAINNWEYVDIWRTGLEYLPADQRLYSSWTIHYTVSGEKHANISACPTASLGTGPYYGPWYVGQPGQVPIEAHTGDYLFAVPQDWADAHTNGRPLVTGRFRDGGLSGLGPTMYAIPTAGSTPPALDTELDFTTLLQYGTVEGSDNYTFPDAADGYNHADYWREACYISAGHQSAVAVIGLKARGFNWYGYHGEWMPLDWIIADVPLHTFDDTDPFGKGWRSHDLSPMIAFYDMKDLAAVADGSMDSHIPQPYAAMHLPDEIFFGSLHEIFSAAYDPINHLLFITEFVFLPDGALVMHVFRVNSVTGIEENATPQPAAMTLSNHPNPFRDQTTIRFTLPRSALVSLRLYDMLGREVAVLHEGMMTVGSHSIRLDASALELAPGMYRCVASSGEQISQRNVILLR